MPFLCRTDVCPAMRVTASVLVLRKSASYQMPYVLLVQYEDADPLWRDHLSDDDVIVLMRAYLAYVDACVGDVIIVARPRLDFDACAVDYPVAIGRVRHHDIAS